MKQFPKWNRGGIALPECGKPYFGVAPGYRHGVTVRVRPHSNGTANAFPLLGIDRWLYLEDVIEVLDCADNYSKAVETALYRLRSILADNGLPDKRLIENDIKRILWYMTGSQVSGTTARKQVEEESDGNDVNGSVGTLA